MKKLLLLLITVTISAIVTACGGGGGGNTTPPPVATPAPTITMGVAPCTIQAELGGCTTNANFTTINAITATLASASGAILSTKTADSLIVELHPGDNTFTVVATGPGGSTTKSVTVTGTCAIGTTSNGIICVSPTTATLSATSPILYGGTSAITWGYIGGVPTSCITSDNWNNTSELTGTALSNTLTSNTLFTYTCTNAAGTTVATVTVTVCAQGQVITGGECMTPVPVPTGCTLPEEWNGTTCAIPVPVCTPPAVLSGTICVIPPPVKVCTPPALFLSGINDCVYPGGTEVDGAIQIPVGCKTWVSHCWDGAVKFINTTATMAGDNNRPIMFAFFRNRTNLFGIDGMWDFIPIYADDGTLVDQDINGGIAQEIDWVYGNALGLLIHIKETNSCVQDQWNKTTKKFGTVPSSCIKN